ncbi:hypothetical protein NDU88_008731 [Pleurodeles waltl]|uniref:Uncharacterized protein n=1 Tax=Pleurodeles waltl TaxID=8319 RepID=A0AAV7RT86_PLEWA|nr:hypothetical protein NDU88_008731 [Pleurodeles waltl]
MMRRAGQVEVPVLARPLPADPEEWCSPQVRRQDQEREWHPSSPGATRARDGGPFSTPGDSVKIERRSAPPPARSQRGEKSVWDRIYLRLRLHCTSEAIMVKAEHQKLPQTNKIDNYAQTLPAPGTDKGPMGDCPRGKLMVGGTATPSTADLMMAMQESKSEVVHKIDVVAIEVNLLRADLCRMSEGLAQMEKNVEMLQQEEGFCALQC